MVGRYVSWLAIAGCLIGHAAIGLAEEHENYVTLLAPNGGETLVAGEVTEIQWHDFDTGCVVSRVVLTLLRDGQPYLEIANIRYPYWASFDWRVCPIVEDGSDYTVHIRATCSSDPNIAFEDTSDAPFTITNGGGPVSFDVTHPDGGETWTTGQPQTITWTSVNPAGYVAAWLHRGGERVTLLGYKPVVAGELKFDLDAAMPVRSDYTVRLVWHNECGLTFEDSSAAPFTIAGSDPPPAITVTSPNGGEVWPADSEQMVTWTATDPSGTVEIWLLNDDAGVSEYLGSAPTDAGSLPVSLHPCLVDDDAYRIELHWRGGRVQAMDGSDASFEIAGAVTPEIVLTAPAGGANLVAGTSAWINWNSSVAQGEVSIDLHDDGEFLCHLGVTGAAVGAWLWEIPPGIAAGTYTVQVRHRYCGAEDAVAVTISGGATPTLTLTSPTVAATWPAGSLQTIAWESENLTGDVRIFLPNNGSTQGGFAVVPVERGSFTWPIAPTLEWPPDPNAPATIARGVWVFADVCGVPLSDRSAAVTVSEALTPFGDLNADGAVDLADLAGLQTCYTGRPAVIPPGPVCDSFDLEPDGDVDEDDLAAVEAGITGPLWEGE